ncbi:MAG: nitroreductase family protein [Alphaproteobacteria bacterium]|nr:nitroreductase family protein [Alphaproteobacteria bacterium]MCB9697450.1 nitroreductase family protein [Alphaproteobacteria bacterium]
MNDLSELMASRRSVRAYADRPVDEVLVRALLADAVAAPSPSNAQPWRFLVVTSRERIAAMASAVREATARIASHVTPEGRAAFVAYGDYFVRFEAAPVVIVAIHRGRRVLGHLVDDALPGDDRARIEAMERDSALAATAMAVQNLLLSAHARGLGASPMTGPMVAADQLLGLLGVPAGWGIAAVVPVGWPAEHPSPTARKPLDAVVTWLR